MTIGKIYSDVAKHFAPAKSFDRGHASNASGAAEKRHLPTLIRVLYEDVEIRLLLERQISVQSTFRSDAVKSHACLEADYPAFFL